MPTSDLGSRSGRPRAERKSLIITEVQEGRRPNNPHEISTPRRQEEMISEQRNLRTYNTGKKLHKTLWN